MMKMKKIQILLFLTLIVSSCAVSHKYSYDILTFERLTPEQTHKIDSYKLAQYTILNDSILNLINFVAQKSIDDIIICNITSNSLIIRDIHDDSKLNFLKQHKLGVVQLNTKIKSFINDNEEIEKQKVCFIVLNNDSKHYFKKTSKYVVINTRPVCLPSNYQIWAQSDSISISGSIKRGKIITNELRLNDKQIDVEDVFVAETKK